MTEAAKAKTPEQLAEMVQQLRKFPLFFLNGSHWMNSGRIEPLCAEAADVIESLALQPGSNGPAINLDRLQSALASETIAAPAGMSIQETCALIESHGQQAPQPFPAVDPDELTADEMQELANARGRIFKTILDFAQSSAVESTSNATTEPCQDAATMGKFACADRHQCWEPCGELGHSAEHAKRAPEEFQSPPPKQRADATAALSDECILAAVHAARATGDVRLHTMKQVKDQPDNEVPTNVARCFAEAIAKAVRSGTP